MPFLILTDHDEVMRKGVDKRILPKARHKLFSWHMERNVLNNIHCNQFNKGFNVLLRSKCSIDEFDIYYEQLMHECNLE